MIFLACAGAIIASLYMLLTQGLTVLNARRTGVLVSKSYGKAKIERAVDAEFRQAAGAGSRPWACRP
jgi:hypothetical protein